MMTSQHIQIGFNSSDLRQSVAVLECSLAIQVRLADDSEDNDTPKTRKQ